MTRLPVVKTYKLYVGGAFARSESGRHVAAEDHEGEGEERCRTSERATGHGASWKVRSLSHVRLRRCYFGFCASPVIGTKRTGITFFFSKPFAVRV